MHAFWALREQNSFQVHCYVLASPCTLPLVNPSAPPPPPPPVLSLYSLPTLAPARAPHAQAGEYDDGHAGDMQFMSDVRDTLKYFDDKEAV